MVSLSMNSLNRGIMRKTGVQISIDTRREGLGLAWIRDLGQAERQVTHYFI